MAIASQPLPRKSQIEVVDMDEHRVDKSLERPPGSGRDCKVNVSPGVGSCNTIDFVQFITGASVRLFMCDSAHVRGYASLSSVSLA